ncbi:MAG: hypothetical protein IMY74_11170, partial [Bacteroidetes bacterium]|nr:hypothetical protein [Bacteroidota bacterium]
SRRWLIAATEALAHLIKHRDISTADQWSIIASAKLLSMSNYPENILSRELIVQHTSRVCKSIFQEQILYADDDRYVGGFSSDGRTTPTATRVEGLLAALGIISHKDVALCNTISASVQAALVFLLQAQITTGKYSGGIPRAVRRLDGDRAFNRRVREVRIDYIQHALSAMIQYERVGEDSGTSKDIRR